jgi:exodeoxyribonuclease-3
VAAEARSVVKIATFNVNGVNTRLPQLLGWLARERPDVACLQELKAEDARFPAQALRDAGYVPLWHGQRSWNGVAILARGRELLEVRRGLPGEDDDGQSRYLEAAVGGVLVACLYLPNGNPQPGPKFDYKLRWFDRLIAHAATLCDAEAPAILAGDFNVVPTDFDIYDPKSWKRDALLQPRSRAAYERLLAQGWTDALRARHPGERVYTFWDYFRNHWARDAGLRIDHLLLNRALAPRLVDAGVDRWVRGEPHASDHAPAWVTLKDGEPGAITKAKAKAKAKLKRKTSPGVGAKLVRKRRAKPSAKAVPKPGAKQRPQPAPKRRAKPKPA